ncbi:putative iron-responsive transcriptional activator, partial [Candida maltosa Xu316]
MTDRVIHRVPLDDLDLEKQKFSAKDDIKPWLQNRLLPTKGIHVVIERSDTTKIIFKCKNKEKKTKIILSKNSNSKIPIRRHTSCPFKIRANYSVRNKVWSLSVIDDKHDHAVDSPSSLNLINLPTTTTTTATNVDPIINSSTSLISNSDSTGSILSQSISSSNSINKSDSPKPKTKSPPKKGNARASKSASSSGRSSLRSSITSFNSQSSRNTSVEDFNNPVQPPTSMNSMIPTNSYDSNDSSPYPSSMPQPQPIQAPRQSQSQPQLVQQQQQQQKQQPGKRRKSASSALLKVKRLKDTFSNVSPIQEIPTSTNSFIGPSNELQALPPPLPHPRSKQQQQQQQQQKQTRQPRQPRQPKPQRAVQQSEQSFAPPPRQQQQPQQQHNSQSLSVSPDNQQTPSYQANHDETSPRMNIPQEQTRIVQSLQNLQVYVRDKIKDEILDNKNIHESVKTDLLDSFVSQVILDYRNYLSPQFLFSLRQNLFDKRMISIDSMSDLGQGDNDQQQVHQQSHQHHQQQSQQQQHHQQQQQQQQQQFTPQSNRKINLVQNWLPGSTPGVGGLIRLSPLLNDNDNNEYAASVVGTSSNNPNNNALDNLTHLPGITTNTLNYLMQLPPPGNSTMGINPTQQLLQQSMPPIQTPNQQLPPLNTIQKLPSSGNPNTSSNNPNSSSSSSTLPHPLNSVGSTLNPSSLLKTSSKNTNSNINNNNNANNNSVFNSYFMNPSATSPAFIFNNTSNPTNSNTPNINKDNNVNNNQNNNSNNNSNILNTMPNYDSGW